MTAINTSLERHHRPIIFFLMFVVVFFAASCTFHDIIPVCHYLFACDHALPAKLICAIGRADRKGRSLASNRAIHRFLGV